MLKLEKNEDVSDTIDAIFRSAHNIKGAARGVGVNDVGDIAHHIESMFADIKNKTRQVNPQLIDLCLEAVDKMTICLQCYKDKSTLSFDLNDLLSRLKNPSILPNKNSPVNPDEEPAKTEKQSINKKKQTSKIENQSTRTKEETDKIKNQSINTREQSAKIEQQPTKQEEKATKTTEKKVKSHSNEQESIRVTIENLDRVSALTEEIQVIKIAIDDHYVDLNKLMNKTKQLEHSWKEMGFALQSFTDKETDTHLQQLYTFNSDHLMEINLALQQLNKNMHSHINELTILSNSLLEEVRMLRLIPASTLLGTLPRTVRDIAQELKKQVNINIIGDAVKMDRMVLEGLRDPIIHLLRNAIDHGIETPEVRQANGKNPIGNINIEVREHGDQILISVSDDGAGIDLTQVADLAVAKNLITQAERNTMTDNAILQLLFSPGFSTKEIITTVSGRGVGLDVVKSNIDNLKGFVDIKTELHKGTVFNLRVPLTLASERGLLIRSGGQPFVVPTNLVDRVLIIHTNDIIDIEASQAILIDKHPIPLRILADILGFPRKETAKKDQLPILIIRKGSHSVALLVEEIINEREIVIKPLQAPLTNVPCVAGGTLAGSGQAIIVLNASDVMTQALKAATASPFTLTDQKEELAVTKPHILVVDDSITTRTLEKNILESQDYQVTVAVNGKEAWDLLQKQKFSLLITDVMMPIMDGFALTERVKTSDQLRSLPVIIVTSLDSEAEKKRGIDAGANAYIVKNEFESDKLLSIVEQLV